jgi:hypothetical protein
MLVILAGRVQNMRKHYDSDENATIYYYGTLLLHKLGQNSGLSQAKAMPLKLEFL